MRYVSPSVWVHNRATECWDTMVPTFIEAEWIKNFQMSEDTFLFLCRQLQPQLQIREKDTMSFSKHPQWLKYTGNCTAEQIASQCSGAVCTYLN